MSHARSLLGEPLRAVAGRAGHELTHAASICILDVRPPVIMAG